MLTWDTYRTRGGRYTYQQATSWGGFNSLSAALRGPLKVAFMPLDIL